jgi:hypothetical protein
MLEIVDLPARHKPIGKKNEFTELKRSSWRPLFKTFFMEPLSICKLVNCALAVSLVSYIGSHIFF